jgi:ribosomal protein S27E
MKEADMPGIKNERTSVIVVIITLICFFPLGIYLLHRRLTEDKSELKRNGGTVKVFGWVLTGLGILYLILFSFNGTEFDGFTVFLITFVLIIFPGIITLRGARKMRVLGERYNRYYSIIKRGVTSIPEIAKEVNIPGANAAKEISGMIDSYFLPGTYVDFTLGEVILQGSSNSINKSVVHNQTITQGRSKPINCRSCGANSVVFEGITSTCDYCGSPLIYPEAVN